MRVLDLLYQTLQTSLYSLLSIYIAVSTLDGRENTSDKSFVHISPRSVTASQWLLLNTKWTMFQLCNMNAFFSFDLFMVYIPRENTSDKIFCTFWYLLSQYGLSMNGYLQFKVGYVILLFVWFSFWRHIYLIRN
jgi:hypothetical protein